MKIQCPECGLPIDSEAAKWLDLKLGPDPFRNFFPAGYFSNENSQTVAKAKPSTLNHPQKL